MGRVVHSSSQMRKSVARLLYSASRGEGSKERTVRTALSASLIGRRSGSCNSRTERRGFTKDSSRKRKRKRLGQAVAHLAVLATGCQVPRRQMGIKNRLHEVAAKAASMPQGG